MYADRIFTVTGTEAISIAFNRPLQASGGLFTLLNIASSDDYIVSQNTSGVWSGNLTAGTYQLTWSMAFDDQAFSGEVISFVPAPGALALLGAAGIMGRRRRN
jgi:hypothetical protein